MRALGSMMLCSIVACAAPADPSSAGSTGAEDEWVAEEPEVVHHEGAIEALGITPPETPWVQMDEFEREMYMVGKVMPIMHELFARHDAARYAQMECESCHGRDMREIQFAMPSKHLYRLPREGTPAWANMERDFGPMVSFMTETVTPVMGTLLGESSYTCGHCHVITE
jgi:hypothetical protein